jgi:hypothetical protein
LSFLLINFSSVCSPSVVCGLYSSSSWDKELTVNWEPSASELKKSCNLCNLASTADPGFTRRFQSQNDQIRKDRTDE